MTDDMSTVALSWKNKRALQDVSNMFKSMGRESKMSYDECFSYMRRECKKIPQLMQRIEDLYKSQNDRCIKVLKHVDNIGLQCSFCGKKSSVKFLKDITKIPELNEFMPDEDMILIRENKK